MDLYWHLKQRGEKHNPPTWQPIDAFDLSGHIEKDRHKHSIRAKTRTITRRIWRALDSMMA